MSLSAAAIIRSAFGPEPPVRVEARGEHAGPENAACRLVFRDDTALAQLARAPGELGLARAYVAGQLDIEGDLFALLRTRASGAPVRFGFEARLAFLAQLGTGPWRTPPSPPPEEIDLGGRLGRHGLGRDSKAISHHYGVGNVFYELLLGPSMTYSCAVFEHADDPLALAQANKMELICRKLGLEPGMTLLDVGCGWGSLVRYAAEHYGVRATGITISREQAAFARQRIEADNLSHLVDIRLCDYRQLGEKGGEERFDAISSVGMAEHVGRRNLGAYFNILQGLLVPRGRLLNHQIGIGPDRSRPAGTRASRVDRDSFVNRYVFPDGELLDVGELVALAQEHNLEVRHVESLCERYALTTRRWLDNLESNWDQAVTLVGAGRARVWRLYLAGAAVNFELGSAQIHQVLAVNTALNGSHRGENGLPLRLVFERQPLSDTSGESHSRADSASTSTTLRPHPRI